MQSFSESGHGIYAVIERKEKRFIGKCGLQLTENTELTELDFLFYSDAITKGFAAEALMGVLRSAFNDFEIEKVVSHIHHENKQSIQEMEKIGMCYGQNTKFDGTGMVVYSIEKPIESVDSIFRSPYQNSPRLSSPVWS